MSRRRDWTAHLCPVWFPTSVGVFARETIAGGLTTRLTYGDMAPAGTPSERGITLSMELDRDPGRRVVLILTQDEARALSSSLAKALDAARDQDAQRPLLTGERGPSDS